MTYIAAGSAVAGSGAIFREARVLSLERGGQLVRVYLDDVAGIQDIYAKVALPYDNLFSRGDKVLVTGDSVDNLYIIGVVSRKKPRVSSVEGVYTLLEESRERSVFQIYSPENELLVEYDVRARKARINCERGDIALTAPSGNISFQAKGGIHLESEAVTLRGGKRVDVSAGEEQRGESTRLSLNNQQMNVDSRDLRFISQRTQLYSEEVVCSGKRFLGNMLHSRVNVEKLELYAQSIRCKAKNLYQTVEQLSQVKVGRLKAFVASTFHLSSKSSVFNSGKDFKVKSDKIHLG